MKDLAVRPAEDLTSEPNGSLEREELGYGNSEDGPEDGPDSSSMFPALPSITKAEDGEDVSIMEARDFFSLEHTDSTPSQSKDKETLVEKAHSKDTKMLVEKVGKLLSRIVAKGAGGGEVWGLKARWQRLVGDMSMCREALLKQVRAYQGSKWQTSPEQFRIFASACLQVSEAYMESGSDVCGKRELFSAQMLLRITVKQAQQFDSYPQYRDLVSCLQNVETKIKAL